MKVWITKYALSTGIFEAEVNEPNSTTPGLIVAPGRVVGRFDQYFHGEGREWHRTPEAAVLKAEKMRAEKIASLRKSIAKLEKLKFEA